MRSDGSIRQLRLPFYEPYFPAPERAVLTLLYAALVVAERALHDAHPQPRSGSQPVATTAHLLIGRCSELRGLLDLYDGALDADAELDADVPF